MDHRKYIPILIGGLLASGCMASAENRLSDETAKALQDSGLKKEDLDETYDESSAVSITLKKDSISCESDQAEISGTAVLIKEPGTYIVEGELDEGKIRISCEKDGEVKLVLKNVQLHSSSGPAIFIENAEQTRILVPEGSSSSVSVTGEDEDGKTAAVHSKDDLILCGGGTLELSSEKGDGIHVNDSFAAADMALTVTAGSDGIDVNDDVILNDLKLTVKAAKDGIHAGDEEKTELNGNITVSGGSIVIEAEDDGMQSAGNITYEDCELNIKAGDLSENRTAAADTQGAGAPGMMPGSPFAGMDQGDAAGRENAETWMRPGMGRESEDTVSGATPGTGDTSGMVPGNGMTPPGNGELPYSGMMPGSGENGNAAETAPADGSASGAEGYGRRRRERTGGMRPGMPGNGMVPGGTQSAGNQTDTGSSSKGITAAGTVTFISGTYDLKAADDAVNSDTDVSILAGAFTVTAGDDALHADERMQISGGTVTVTSCYEGIEAKEIIIDDGTLMITASDDGINSTAGSSSGYDEFADDGSSITINGGVITVDSGGDGIDGNGDITMNGGTVTVYGPVQQGNGALDCNGTFNVNSGRLMAGGASGMAEYPASSSKLNMIVIRTSGTGTVTVKDEAGNIIAEYSSEKAFSDLLIADEALQKGSTYTIEQSGKTLGTITVNDTVNYFGTAGRTDSFLPGNTETQKNTFPEFRSEDEVPEEERKPL